LFNLVAEMYHCADDKEQFVQFDRMLTSNLQSLNLHITVKILDYTMAATKDAARAAESTAGIQLTQVDLKKLEWNPNSASTKIGYGAFSTVCTGKYKKEYVAIKVIQQLGTMTARDLKLITKEAMIMQFADHPNILKLKGVSLAKGLLVMELALCSLADYLHHPNDLARERCQSLRAAVPSPSMAWKLGIVRNIADAIRYLHSFSILHRDIKSANVLLFHDSTSGRTTAKVGDFGLALAVELVSRTSGTFHTATASTVSSQGSQGPRAAGTPNYMAPELFDRRPGESIAYSEASDVYSLGVLANEVLTEKVPWEADAREVDVMKWVLHDRLRPRLLGEDGCNFEVSGLVRVIGGSDAINTCWNQRPSQRCTAEDLYRSTWESFTPTSTPPPQSLEAALAEQTKEEVSNNDNAVERGSVSPQPSPKPVAQVQRISVKSTLVDPDPAVAAAQDQETAELIAAFAEEIQSELPSINREHARDYAAVLVKESIYDVPRLRKITLSLKAGAKAAMDKWFQKVRIHPFDAADILEDTPLSTSKTAQNQAGTDAVHGVAALSEWLKINVPDVALPHKRQYIAEVLCANNITCTARLRRLAGREEAVAWLVSMEIDKLDAEDVCAKIGTVFAGCKRPEPGTTLAVFPPAVHIPASVALYDLEDFIALLAADLQKLLPDMTATAAARCSEALFESQIYTVTRLLHQLSLKSNKAAWLKGLGWTEFDVADILDTVECQGYTFSSTGAAEPHGVAPLVQWLTEHLSSLKLASKRLQYAEALVAHNVSTVHRLIVRGSSEAWLVSIIGFDKLDAADCAAVLAPLAKQDTWAVTRARKAAAETKRVADEALRRKMKNGRASKEAWRERREDCCAVVRGCSAVAGGCCAVVGGCCSAVFDDTVACPCTECMPDCYPAKYWLPGDDPRADNENSTARDRYSCCMPCCCLLLPPQTLEMCLCESGYSSCSLYDRIVYCPLSCVIAVALCIGSHVCDNLGCKCDPMVRYVVRRLCSKW
jgi:serine/threonine protein kinase